MASTIVGIDIGSAAVRAVEVQNGSKAPTITRSFEVPLPEGSVRRGEVIEVSTVASALKRLWAAGGFTAKDVALGMGGPRVFARDLLVPRAPLAQIRESLPFHVQEHLPVPVADALLDFYPITEKLTDDGPMIDGLLVAAIKEAVSANVEAVTLAGLRPVHVDLIPFALTRAITPLGSAGHAVIVGMGANTTNVIVVNGGVPQFVRIIASGGDDITRALASQFELDHQHAEALKRRLGMGAGPVRPEDRPALDVIYGVVREQLNSVRTTLSFYANSSKFGLPERVILTGAATHLIGMSGAIAEITGLPVAQSDALASAELGKKLRSSTREEQDAMATAYGLALGTSA